MARKNNVKRADGRYAVQVYLGTIDGKRKYKTVYGKTQKEADDKAQDIKIALNKGIDVTAENDTFGFWSEHWLKNKEITVSPKRYLTLMSHQNHLKVLNNSKLNKITTADIQLIINNLAVNNPTTNKPSSADLLRSVRNAANQIFNLAISNRILDYNPVNAVVITPMKNKETRRALTNKEQSLILTTQHRAQTASLIMMLAGLRRGELIVLTWNDIDFTNRTITINKSSQFVKNKPIVKNTAKTKAGNRVITIPAILIKHLGIVEKESIYVCPSSKNNIHSETSWRYMWNEYLDTLNQYSDNIPDNSNVRWITPQNERKINITPHMLRHTYATNLYFAGVDVMTAKTLLGHSDIKTTLGIYTHLDDIHKKKNIDKYEEYLNNMTNIIGG